LVVVRYFGGTKLGVSGLIKAYKSAAKDALEKNKIIKKYISSEVILSFEYPLMNSVMRIIKEEKLRILKQDFDSNCKIYIELKKNQEKITRKKIDKIRGVIIK
jgi:putative IMPACT (imprinted ancient) family translation regulator